MGSSSLQHHLFQRDTYIILPHTKADPNTYAPLPWWIDAFDKLRSNNKPSLFAVNIINL